MSIQVLSPEIQNQIAAGEVVERPSSVVKECIENSIDAGATHIEIRIEEGGKKLIQITDNGIGMSPQDAEKSILRHATSKISSIDDLFSIRSYGFRGEALAAISSVSDFELVTKQDGNIQGIKITHQGPSHTPANTGTIITIRNLFSPTPARLQYLKTNETEYRQCLKVVQSFALSNPEISFKLFKDETLTLDLPKTNQRGRIQSILKRSEHELLEITPQENRGIKISGFTSSPGHYAGNKNQQYIFVNGRHIEDHRLAFAIREAYVQSCGIEKHLYPIFGIFIQIDPILVDVNVHPRKTEVKFAEPGEVFALIKGVIIHTLRSQNQTPNQFSQIQSFPKATPFRISSNPASSFNYKLFSPDQSFAQKNEQRNISAPAPELQGVPNKIQGELTALSQIQNKYILAKNDEGLYLFDQHALHERLRFEKLYEQAWIKKIKTQKLLIPQEIELSQDEISILQENTSDLENLGFGLEFNKNLIALKEVPQLLKSENFSQLFQDFAAYFESEQVGENFYERILRKVLEYKSCRGSVFFGDPMKLQEMQQLLDQFQSTQWKLLCPHGRPNHVFWSYDEIDRMFHR